MLTGPYIRHCGTRAILASWLNLQPLAPADFLLWVLTAHLWSRCEVSGNQGHREHPLTQD